MVFVGGCVLWSLLFDGCWVPDIFAGLGLMETMDHGRKNSGMTKYWADVVVIQRTAHTILK